ncbi:NAD(P)/FAD-dependent oxidoreductase [Actinomadura parmotrematis]|uniref:NAD(P)/FAD-dependent oxidoreductase n=1 Tax=Actinomadura parmotrematis TaxID=2864039 RepID=UPI0027E36DE3|nr:FAD-dependent oxidoreductase [Actinomadura parmotrematis]
MGGGYGGIAVAKALDEDADVVLVDPREAFVHAAGALRALVRPDWADHVFFPYDRLLRRGRIVRDRATGLDAGGIALASGGRVDADHVVLATGSDYPFPAKHDAPTTAAALDRLRLAHKELTGARRVLIAGAGPVGLELAGEIKAVWPDKHVIITDPAPAPLPGVISEVRDRLHALLDDLGVELLTGTTVRPPTEPGVLAPFTADGVTADLWYRAHGARPNTAWLAGITTPAGLVPVTGTLEVAGHDGLYAIGDITDVPEDKRAGAATRHAAVVAANILARLRGEPPAATYTPGPPAILLPLGPATGVGQLPGPDGPVPAPVEQVVQYKAADLMSGRFAELFDAPVTPPGR